MVLEYNKKRRINKTGSSPRDLQNRLNNEAASSWQTSQFIMDLMTQVTTLTDEVKKLKLEGGNTSPATVVSTDKKYTEEEFNIELVKALKKENSIFNLKIEARDSKIDALEYKLKVLEESKDKLSTTSVTTKPPHPSEEAVNISRRPTIEDTVIDPTENKGKLESHINIEEVKSDTKADMKNKVNMLKELLGGS